MDLVATAHLVDNFDQIVRRAINDDLKSASSDNPSSESVLAYLDTIDKALLEFRASSDIVGRRQECHAMVELFHEEGTLALVSGGTSVGISKLLGTVMKDARAADSTLVANTEVRVRGQRPVKVVHFDGRCGNWMAKPLREQAVRLKCPSHLETSLGGLQVSVPVPEPGSSSVAAVTACIPALWEAAVKADAHVVLVLDEANRFLESDDYAVEDTKELFNKLVMYTKPKSHISVVLLSTDPTLTSRLDALGLRSSRLQSTLVIGEASPAEMLAQLQELGVGKHLRELLVRVYGGHLWHIHVGVRSLSSDIVQDREAQVRRAPMDSISHALWHWEQAGGDRKELESVLEEVARCGFCPLHAEDKRARALAKDGVCTFVAEDAEEYFIDPAVRQGRSGLAASTQLARVLIPVVLERRGGLPAGREV
jgi:hypothetical protein